MDVIEKRCRDFLSSYSVVGIDTMIFIYHFEENNEYLPFTRALFGLVEDGLIEGKTSVITRLEILVNPERKGNKLMVDRYKMVLERFPHLEVVAVDAPVTDLAAIIRAKYGVRTPDAIHLDSAIMKGAQSFVTNDESLKRVSEIEILNIKDIINTF